MKDRDPIEESICKISRERNLTPLQRVLLGHDGSMTKILELVSCEPVILTTISQAVVPCPDEIAEKLETPPGQEVNEREIVMLGGSDQHPLLYAKSHTPICRLKPEFRSDLMRADIPIGKIMRKHRIESRRVILEIGVKEQDGLLSKVLRCSGPFLWRSYNIIAGEKPLITVSEFLPAQLVQSVTGSS